MNLDKLHDKFLEYQDEQPSPYEQQYKLFLESYFFDEDPIDLLLEVLMHSLETRRQLKDYIVSNNPGMYD